MGPISMTFKSDGIVEGDFGDDGRVDLIANYKINNDTIQFNDIEGASCPGTGKYKIYTSKYWVSFDILEDTCNGRIQSMMGFWTRPAYDKLLKELDDEISKEAHLESYLNRARLYLAIGKSREAKADLDIFLKGDSSSARAYINRAGTCFPSDIQGALSDCNKAISLDPSNKNAYFLRGLSLYELGRKEEACKDFKKAVELGFTILAKEEEEKCDGYW